MRLSHVVAATDFSAESNAAALLGAALAGKLGATVSLLHVATEVPASSAARTTRHQELFDQRGGELDALAARVEAAWKVMPDARVVCSEAIADAVCRAAVDAEADLVCTGTRGLGGLAGFFVGSVAAKVLRQAPCSVLTTRMTKAPSAAALERIVVGTDLSEPAGLALDVAASLARAFSAELEVVHVVDPSVPFARYGEIAPTETRDATLLAELETACKAALGTLPHRATVVEGTQAAEALCEIAERRDASLLVVSTQGRTGLARLLIGSVAEKVVRLATMPVLTVRPLRT